MMCADVCCYCSAAAALQGRARPSIAALYNWRYGGLQDLPAVTQVRLDRHVYTHTQQQQQQQQLQAFTHFVM
jgi:hypothetical protein